MRSKELDETAPSVARLALLLAAFLGLIVVGLNLVAPRPFQVSQDQFLELIDKGAVASIEIGNHGLRSVLLSSMEFDQRGRRVRTQQVRVDLGETTADNRITIADSAMAIADFEARGIAISYADAGAQGETDALWLTVVIGLLGIGAWHLFAQARHNRLNGSPRQQLRELETEFREGRLSRDEYEKQAAEISTDV